MRLARRILINLLLLLLAIDFIGPISPISLSGYRSALFFFSMVCKEYLLSQDRLHFIFYPGEKIHVVTRYNA